jgi:hypothetical protein
MLDIVGARFHCAICDSVDICSNCESAGLPGNLDSSDDSHNSSHIMIKVQCPTLVQKASLTSEQIPYPLETTELQTASRRAANLWTGRDAPNVLGGLSSKSKPSSVYSSYARTVIGTGKRNPLENESEDGHHKYCNGCKKVRLLTISSSLVILTYCRSAYLRSPIPMWLMSFLAIIL